MLNEIPFRTVWRHITSIEKPVLRGRDKLVGGIRK